MNTANFSSQYLNEEGQGIGDTMEVSTQSLLGDDDLQSLSSDAVTTMQNMTTAGENLAPALFSSNPTMSSAAFQNNTALNQSTSVNNLGNIAKSQANGLSMTHTNLNSATSTNTGNVASNNFNASADINATSLNTNTHDQSSNVYLRDGGDHFSDAATSVSTDVSTSVHGL
jgi:hypothetical protein